MAKMPKMMDYTMQNVQSEGLLYKIFKAKGLTCKISKMKGWCAKFLK